MPPLPPNPPPISAPPSLVSRTFNTTLSILQFLLDAYSSIIHYQNQYHPAFASSQYGDRYGTDSQHSVAYGTFTYNIQQRLNTFFRNFDAFQVRWKRYATEWWNSNTSGALVLLSKLLGSLSIMLILYWKTQFIVKRWRMHGTFFPEYTQEPSFLVQQTLPETLKQRRQNREIISEPWRRTFFGHEESIEEKRADLEVDSRTGRVIGLKRLGGQSSNEQSFGSQGMYNAT